MAFCFNAAFNTAKFSFLNRSLKSVAGKLHCGEVFYGHAAF